MEDSGGGGGGPKGCRLRGTPSRAAERGSAETRNPAAAKRRAPPAELERVQSKVRAEHRQAESTVVSELRKPVSLSSDLGPRGNRASTVPGGGHVAGGARAKERKRGARSAGRGDPAPARFGAAWPWLRAGPGDLLASQRPLEVHGAQEAAVSTRNPGLCITRCRVEGAAGELHAPHGISMAHVCARRLPGPRAGQNLPVYSATTGHSISCFHSSFCPGPRVPAGHL